MTLRDVATSTNDDGTASTSLPEMIEAGDLELLQAFQQDIAVAQRAYNLLMAQMAARYQLRDGDGIDPKGKIMRGVG